MQLFSTLINLCTLQFSKVIDSFLDDPTDIPVTFSEKDINSIDSVSKLASTSKKGRSHDTLDLKTSVDRMERDKIRKDADQRQAQLLDEFKLKCDVRKKALEERLKRRRDHKSSCDSVDGDNGLSEDGKFDESMEIDLIESKYDDVVRMFQTLDETQVQKVHVDSLMGAMDKLIKGDAVSSLTLTLPSVLNQPRLHTDVLPKIESQDFMKEEVKRISTIYSEEKQKLDLTMQMKHARQRQALQRKLLERRQGWANVSDATSHSPEVKTIVRTPGTIPFGGARITNQPSFRGLSFTTEPIPSTGESKTTINDSLSSRGLGLQHLQLKK